MIFKDWSSKNNFYCKQLDPFYSRKQNKSLILSFFDDRIKKQLGFFSQIISFSLRYKLPPLWGMDRWGNWYRFFYLFYSKFFIKKKFEKQFDWISGFAETYNVYTEKKKLIRFNNFMFAPIIVTMYLITIMITSIIKMISTIYFIDPGQLCYIWSIW